MITRNTRTRIFACLFSLLAALLLTAPATAQNAPIFREGPVADSHYWLMTAALIGSTIADIEFSQHCIKSGACREGNPLISSSRSKAYTVQFGLVVGQSFLAYRLKKRGVKTWWIPHFAMTTAHGIGASIGMRFVF